MFFNYTRDKRLAENEPAAVSPTPSPEPTLTPAPSATPAPAADTPAPTATPTPTPRPMSEEILALRREYNNDDIVGYLRIPDSSINYPVVYYTDNDFYLERDVFKNINSTGSIFMDCENNVERDEKNFVLYGHNMKADIMFHAIRYYNDKNYFENHRYITFNTLYGNYTWEVFSFYKTNIDFNYINVLFKSDEEFGELVREMKRRSHYETNVDVTQDDRVLTLSTCTNQEEDTRYVVNAKLIRQDS
ncbi:MAG: class B sortase [Clostridiales bacterium]|nr:class B sortase [Clostridiales bacterium]